MIAVLIAAGVSRRFWPLKEKSFFPVAGTMLLTEQIKRLKLGGVREILLVAGAHNKKEMRRLFPGMQIVEQKDLSLGMRGALLSALPRCKKQTVMIVSANDLIEPTAYRDLLERSSKLNDGGLILGQKVSSYFPGGYLSLKGERVTGIVEKPGAGKEPSSMVNIDAHVHTDASRLLAGLKAVRPTKDDGYELALDHLLKEQRYDLVPYRGIWQPVKYPWHLLSLLPILLPASDKPVIDRSASIDPTAVVQGSVVIGKNVRIFPHATVTGPCFIGDGTIVANNALVRGSSIGKNCVVGYSTEIARSILGNDVWTHMNYVGDSILDDNVSLGSGTATGNLRLDEGVISSAVQGEQVTTQMEKFGCVIGAGCRVGVNVSLSPGIKIGAGSFLGSALLVSQDIPDQSFVRQGKDGELSVRPNRTTEAPKSRDGFRRKLG